MRIAIDPVPLVLGIYAQAGGLMHRAVARAEDGDPKELGRRFGKRRDETTDRDVKRLVKAVHSEVKTSDKLLKKTSDVWKISAETDLVDLVVHRRGEGEDPRSYVLLRPDDVREILRSIRAAAEGAGEEEETLVALDEAAEAVSGRPSDYYTFGFDPWES
jgi:DNA polymerase II large subunit